MVEANITFNTVLVIFPKELGMMSSTGLVEWLDVLRRFWDGGTAQSKATRPSSLSCRLSRTNWTGLSHGQHASYTLCRNALARHVHPTNGE